MRRLDNDIIFEEMNQWACMEQFADCMIGNMAAVVLEKQGNLKSVHPVFICRVILALPQVST